MGAVAFFIGMFIGVLIGLIPGLAIISNKLARRVWLASIKKKPLVLTLRKDKRVELETLDYKNGLYEIEGKVVNISPKDMFILDKTPILIYYGSLATSIKPEIAIYVEKIKSKFKNLKELLKYQYEDEILKLDPETARTLFDLLENDKKEFIRKVKLLGLKPKDEMFEFLIDQPVVDFEDLLDFIQNVKLEYFESAIEKKVLASNLMNKINIPPVVWWILIILIGVALVIIAMKWFNPPTKEIIHNVCQTAVDNLTNATKTINMG